MILTPQEEKLFKGLKIRTESEIVKNRFTGEEVELCPEAVAIYDLIIGAEKFLYNDQLSRIVVKYFDAKKRALKTKKIEDIFNAAKDVFARNWPKEYMLLID